MRLRPTHSAQISAEVKVGETETGSPLYEQQPVLECPVRFHSPDGQSFVRTASGELVQEQPSAMLPVQGTDPDTGEEVLAADVLEEGAQATLEGLGGVDDWTADDATYQVDSVGVKRARGGRPERVELTLQRNP